MAKKDLEVTLPEEVVQKFGWQDKPEEEMSHLVLEALVMELLRMDRLSEWEAQQLLGIDNLWAMHDAMGRYEVPVIRMTPEEMREEKGGRELWRYPRAPG